MRDVRPDLYYTIAFYPALPEYVQLLYEIEMDRIGNEKLSELASELGLNPSKKELKEVIVDGLELTLKRRVERGEEGVSTYALKTFSWQVEMLKAKLRSILVDFLQTREG